MSASSTSKDKPLHLTCLCHRKILSGSRKRKDRLLFLSHFGKKNSRNSCFCKKNLSEECWSYVLSSTIQLWCHFFKIVVLKGRVSMVEHCPNLHSQFELVYFTFLFKTEVEKLECYLEASLSEGLYSLNTELVELKGFQHKLTFKRKSIESAS